jgi:hypothetical protein
MKKPAEHVLGGFFLLTTLNAFLRLLSQQESPCRY